MSEDANPETPSRWFNIDGMRHAFDDGECCRFWYRNGGNGDITPEGRHRKCGTGWYHRQPVYGGIADYCEVCDFDVSTTDESKAGDG